MGLLDTQRGAEQVIRAGVASRLSLHDGAVFGCVSFEGGGHVVEASTAEFSESPRHVPRGAVGARRGTSQRAERLSGGAGLVAHSSGGSVGARVFAAFQTAKGVGAAKSISRNAQGGSGAREKH